MDQQPKPWLERDRLQPGQRVVAKARKKMTIDQLAGMVGEKKADVLIKDPLNDGRCRRTDAGALLKRVGETETQHASGRGQAKRSRLRVTRKGGKG
jgi:hypothetical protein